MNVEWIGPAALGGAAALALGLSVVLVVVLRRTRLATEESLAQAHAETAALRAHLEALERRLEHPTTSERPTTEYVITHLGATEPSSAGAPVAHVDKALFADLVLRETVVKTASLAHGLRRALSPASRNRIRFEMRQEVRRNRKRRRAEARVARREWEARQRAALTDEDAA